MDLALNNQQKLIRHKTQPTNTGNAVEEIQDGYDKSAHNNELLYEVR